MCARAFERLPMCVNVRAGVRVRRREGEGGREVKMEAEGAECSAAFGLFKRGTRNFIRGLKFLSAAHLSTRAVAGVSRRCNSS